MAIKHIKDVIAVDWTDCRLHRLDAASAQSVARKMEQQGKSRKVARQAVAFGAPKDQGERFSVSAVQGSYPATPRFGRLATAVKWAAVGLDSRDRRGTLMAIDALWPDSDEAPRDTAPICVPSASAGSEARSRFPCPRPAGWLEFLELFHVPVGQDRMWQAG